LGGADLLPAPTLRGGTLKVTVHGVPIIHICPERALPGLEKSTMTDSSVIDGTPLSGELIDGIAEAVLRAPDRRGRSAAIRSIVEEIYESIAWLGRSAPAGDCELSSLVRLRAEAQAHHQRMASCRADEVSTCGAA
jgi:hypothetical protein